MTRQRNTMLTDWLKENFDRAKCTTYMTIGFLTACSFFSWCVAFSLLFTRCSHARTETAGGPCLRKLFNSVLVRKRPYWVMSADYHHLLIHIPWHHSGLDVAYAADNQRCHCDGMQANIHVSVHVSQLRISDVVSMTCPNPENFSSCSQGV